jgi:hypothetical protein
MKRLLNRECSDCGSSRMISISLKSYCNGCGDAPLDIKYEIPPEKAAEILPYIFNSIENNGLKPADERADIPTYEELCKRINSRAK